MTDEIITQNALCPLDNMDACTPQCAFAMRTQTRPIDGDGGLMMCAVPMIASALAFIGEEGLGIKGALDDVTDYRPGEYDVIDFAGVKEGAGNE